MSATAGAMIGRLVLGRYRIVRHLADGGTGALYLARDESSANVERPVVIKWVLPSHSGDQRITELLVRQAQIMGQLSHPHIVSVLDFAEEGGMYIMALEYAHGFPLRDWANYVKQFRGPFPVDIAVHIMIEVLDALDYAHNLVGADGKPLGVIHRDVTPSHILIDAQGCVKLADFGVAGIASEKTSVGDARLEGKFAYLPPESLDRVAASPMGDIYSAGITLHELLAGSNELAGDTMSETVGRVIRHVPTRVDKLRTDVPEALAGVIERAVAKNPATRFKSAAEFSRALSEATPGSDGVAERLRELANGDFHDVRLAADSSMGTLAERETAWRVPAASKTTGSPEQLGDVRPSSPPAPRRTRLGFVIAGVLSLAAAIAIYKLVL